MYSKEFDMIHDEILDWIKSVKFRKKLIGGVDEDDVLKKIRELNELYEKALIAERSRYNALLEQKGGAEAKNGQ